MQVTGRTAELNEPGSLGQDRPWTRVPGGASGAFGFQLGVLRGILRRQAWVIALCVLASLGLAAFYLTNAKSLYTSNTRLLIEPTRPEDLVTSTRAIIPGGGLDRGVVESQIEVIKSDITLEQVGKMLDLANAPEFQPQEAPLLNRAIAAVKALISSPGDGATDPEDAARRRVLGRLSDNLQVDRIEDSYVVQIRYTAEDPALAAAITNAFAKVYKDDLETTRSSMSDSAIAWLDGQLADAQQGVAEADEAIRRFRTDHKLLAAGVVNQQQLEDISTELVTARADRAGAEARLRQFQSLTPAQRQQAALPEAVSNPIILGLRNQYLTAASQLAEVERVYSSQHPDAVRLRGEMKERQALINAEIDRLGLTYENEVAVATAREENIERNLDTLRDSLASSDEGMATLHRLEWNADAAAGVLETIAQQRQQAIELQAHPSSEARIISPATAPRQPSQPRDMLVLALALIGGCAIGGAIAATREIADASFRTPEQLQAMLGLPVIGFVPKVRGSEPLKPAIRDALAAARLACEGGISGRGARTIGVISALPGEGCSTIAVHLASALSEGGSKLVLVDGSGTRDREVEVASAAGQRAAASTAMIGQDLSRGPGITVLDLPALATSPAAAFRAAQADILVMVVEWGKTPRSVIRGVLDEHPGIAERLVGVVFNKVEPRRLARYAEPGSTTAFLVKRM